MNDDIERYPVEKRQIKGEDSLHPGGPDSEAESDAVIERFSAEKQQIRFEDPPELIFFDVDEDSNEADFIRVDDLFRDGDAGETCSPFCLTLFPRCSGHILSGRISRVIRRTLYLSALRLNCTVSVIRVRPNFVQMLAEPGDGDTAETLAREFRADLELQMSNLCGLPEGLRFWSDNCFIWMADTQIGDEKINSMISLYRDE